MADIKTEVDRYGEIVKAIDELMRARVLVGIPEEKDPRRDGGPAGNALIGAVHEFGSPAKNIPARPWLYPGVANAAPQITTILKNTATAVLGGNRGALEPGLNAVGIAAQNSVRLRISSNIPPPLSPRTLAARSRRFGRKLSPAETTTLVDTGQLRASISYIIQK